MPLIVGLLAAGLLSPTAAEAGFGAGQLEEELGSGVSVEKRPDTGRLRFVGTEPGKPIAVRGAGSRRDVALRFAGSLRGELGVGDPGDRLDVSSVETLERGRSSVRLQQLEQGVPVIGGEFVVNLDRNRDVLSLSGEASPRPDLDTDPAVSSDEADDAAYASVALDYGVSPDDLTASKPELSILDSRVMGGPGLGRPTLVWRMEITPADPGSSEPIRQFVAVDAQLGNVALSFSQIAEVKSRVVCDAGDKNASVPCRAPFARVEGQPATGQPDVDLAYDYAGDTYDFFADRFGRDSLDDAGLPLVSTVGFCQSSCPYANAFWNGSQMVYGAGFPAADDVVGHELTHGVTDFSSHLFYYYQSGAINESLSDVFGEFVDLTNGSGDDSPGVRWLLGEDVPSNSNACGADPHIARNMADPGDCGDPDRTQSPDYYYEPDTRLSVGDAGGVHANSGVNNKAAYLLTDGDSFNGQTVAGLEIDKVAHIYYEANNNILTSASDYQDLGAALRQACANLTGGYGIVAADCDQVDRAVLATEMDQQPVAAPTPAAAACVSPGDGPQDVFFDDLEDPTSGNWDQVGSQYWSHSQLPNSFGFDATYATSGVGNLWGYDGPGLSDSSIQMVDDVTIPAGAYLHFDHSHGFVTDGDGANAYDGGVIEYSTDHGVTWTDAGSLLEANGYNGTIRATYAGSGNPTGSAIAGQDAFVADSAGYISSRADLSSLSGQDVRFRFRIVTATGVDDYGWFIDDVRIYTCAPEAADPDPGTTIDSGPAAGSAVTTNAPTFTFSSPDPDVAGFDCKLDSAAFAPCSGFGEHDLAGLAEGPHFFAVRARDAAGNYDRSPPGRSFTVDTVAPGTRIDSGPADGAIVTTSSVRFGFSSPDPEATFECSADDAPFSPCDEDGSQTLSDLTEGGHTFAVRAIDPAGNPDAVPPTRSFTYETEAAAEDCERAKRQLKRARRKVRHTRQRLDRVERKAHHADGRRARRLQRKARKLGKRLDRRHARRDDAKAAKVRAC